jgi:hypothetical protein
MAEQRNAQAQEEAMNFETCSLADLIGVDVWVTGEWWMVVGETTPAGHIVLENEDERLKTVTRAELARLYAASETARRLATPPRKSRQGDA